MKFGKLKFFLSKKLKEKIKEIFEIKNRLDILEKNQLSFLRLQYQSVFSNSTQREIFCNKEYKIYSQSGEDGILLYLFSKIGTTNCSFVEFGIGDGRQCNTANLSLNFGWSGLLIEGNPLNFKKAKNYYKNKTSKVNVIPGFITKENINSLISENGVNGEIDLLSIDLDGNDYWIWKEIDVISPRVVVIEYNSSFGGKNLIVKYDPAFDIIKKHPTGLYHGASLKALEKLAKSKGYILIGCDSAGVNAFFVRKDVAKNKLSAISAEKAYYSQKRRFRLGSLEEQFKKIKNMDFEKA